MIELPRLIDVKYNAFENVTTVLDKLRIKGNGMLLADDFTINVAEEKILDNISSKFSVSTHIIEDASIDHAENVKKQYENQDISFVLAVGGGRVIDVAKYSSYLHKIPFISMPTIASHDGIASAKASLVGNDKRHSLSAQSPIAVIGDIETIANAPRRFMLSGVGDIISNFTALLDWELSNRITGEHISQYAVALSDMSAQSMIINKDIIRKSRVEGTALVMKALITSSMAMCIAGSSRPASGAEHMISHAMDDLIKDKKSLHGEQCGLNSILTMYLHGGDWEKIYHTLHDIGAPTNLQDLGIKNEDYIEAVLKAQSIRPERFTILSAGVAEEAIRKGLEFTRIITD